jgi:alanine dehydrogenase
MIIGVPKEIKKAEYRVGMTPYGAEELKREGHTVLVEAGAGEGSGFPDAEYLETDADVVDRDSLFRKADLIVKVKEPLPPEYELLRDGQVLFTYLHLAPNPELTRLLLNRKVTSLAYETLEEDGGLPLLAPMSEIAGRMAPLAGAWCLQRFNGGAGILPTGAKGVRPARVVILGAGVVGTNAARVSIGIEMETVVINRGAARLQRVDELFMGRVRTLSLTAHNIREELRSADLVIGALLVPGGRTPVVITREMLRSMKPGSAIVDVSVDQGGCAETTRPTTHDSPTYEVDGVIHYSVANMPGAYPRTSTLALTEATMPYIRRLAAKGVTVALKEDSSLRSAANTLGGRVVHKALAASAGLPYRDIADVLG